MNSWTTTRLVCIGSWSPYLHFVEKRAFLRVAGQMSGSPLFPSTFNSSRSGGARPFSLRRWWSMASSSLSYENVAGCYGRQPRSDRFMTRRTERNREKWLLTRHSGRKRAAARRPSRPGVRESMSSISRCASLLFYYIFLLACLLSTRFDRFIISPKSINWPVSPPLYYLAKRPWKEIARRASSTTRGEIITIPHAFHTLGSRPSQELVPIRGRNLA